MSGATTSGFGHVPVTKATLAACAGASVVFQAFHNAASRRSFPPAIELASKLLVFRSPGELLFGCFLLYTFRVVERHVGPAKHASFAFVCTAASLAIQQALLRLSGSTTAAASGPYGLIYACFVHFFLQVPAASKFTMLKYRFSDKVFIYLAGAQLLASGRWSSLVAGTAGMAAGVLYRLNFLGMRRFRFPAVVQRLASSLLGPFLGDTQRTAQVLQPGRPARPAHQHPGAPRPAAARPAQPAVQPSPEALQQLMAMGFERSEAARALQATNNDVNAACAMLLG